MVISNQLQVDIRVRQEDDTHILKDVCAYQTPIATSPPDEDFSATKYTESLEQTYLVQLGGTTDRGNLDGNLDASKKPPEPESATSEVSPPSVENRHSI
jgi:hypothetical protein